MNVRCISRQARHGLTVLAVVGALAAYASPASAHTFFGQTFSGGGSCGAGNFRLQSGWPPGLGYAAPVKGVITLWSIQNFGAPHTAKLKLARAAGGDTFTIVGESAPQTIPGAGYNWFVTRVPVKVGDILGVYYVSGADNGCMSQTGYSAHGATGDPAVNGTLGFAPLANLRVNVAAQIEPDHDDDGFGDESQDRCPSDAGTQGTCPDQTAPETTIARGPVERTEKRKATFEFTASEPRASFECRLKGKGRKRALERFGSCASPRKYRRLRPGRYKFLVAATDAAGNADATPAKWRFRVVERG